VEATSGNTGISFAAIGKALGHNVRIIMPNWMSMERMQIISSYGASILTVSKEEGGFLGSIAKTQEMSAKEKNIFLPRQFENEANSMAHYLTTGPELWWQLRYNDISPDAFVAGVGTGGTIMGVGNYLKQRDSRIKAYPMEPSESPTMSTGIKTGHHRIQGISDEFIPALVHMDKLDEVIDVSDGDSIIMAQMLASQLGLAVGISSGANLLAALKAQDLLHKDAVVVTVFSDDNKKYLSTDLMREEPVKEGYLTTDIELLEYNVFKRVCKTCCDPYLCNQKVKRAD
jgi:cysteine synthase A